MGAMHGAHELPHEAVLVLLRHAPPQRWYPASQAKPHDVPSQVGAALGGGAGHATHDDPQEVTLTLLTHVPAHTWKPATHVNPHETPSHEAVEFGGAGHGVQDAPQVLTERLLTHAPPHRWNPALQTKPHETPSQFAVALAGTEHGVHAAPHELMLVLSTHNAPQRWKPELHVNPQMLAVQVGVEFAGDGHTLPHAPQLALSLVGSEQLPPQRTSPAAQPIWHEYAPMTNRHTGVAAGQTRPQTPQLVASPRSISQPSARTPLQSAQSVSHRIPHETPSHVADECGGDAHGMHAEVPQELNAPLLTQMPPQSWNPPLHV